MRLIGCVRHTHITLLQSVCLLATHVQAVGGHPLQWGAATSGSSATHVQAVGGHPLQWGQLPPDQAIGRVLLYHDHAHTPLGLLPQE